MNNWSPAVAFYLIGACYTELYRTASYSTDHNLRDAKQAMVWKQKAQEALEKVPKHAHRKKLIGKPLPLDAFVQRKLGKWRQRGGELRLREGEMVDAVGVSPLEEMIFMFGGYKRMGGQQLQDSLGRLWWNAGSMRIQAKPEDAGEATDEKGVLALLSACIQRQLGDTASARASCQEFVLGKDREEFKGELREDWVPPVARLEVAACLWDEANEMGKTPAVDENARREKLRECKRLVEEVSNWGGYELDARFGIKVTTAMDTLKNLETS